MRFSSGRPDETIRFVKFSFLFSRNDVSATAVRVVLKLYARPFSLNRVFRNIFRFYCTACTARITTFRVLFPGRSRNVSAPERGVRNDDRLAVSTVLAQCVSLRLSRLIKYLSGTV